MRMLPTFIGPFKTGERLELTKAETATLRRAAEIAEKAAGYFAPDSTQWLDWKRLETEALAAVDSE